MGYENDFSSNFDKLHIINEENEFSWTYIASIKGKSYFVKRLNPQYSSHDFFRSIFRKEYESGKNINHPNIVHYEELHDGKDCYILMENIVGETLDEFIYDNPQFFSNTGNVDNIFIQLFNALKCLHQHDIAYTDLKPQNIMITQVNKDLKLIDLGGCFTSAYTNTAQATVGFISPEQKQFGKLDVTTDVYCVGKLIEYIENNITTKLPDKYRKIKKICLQADKDKRFQNVDKIIKIITHKRRLVLKAAITVFVIFALLVTGKILSYNPYVIALWDRTQFVPRDVQYDIEYDKIYYRITSKENKECAAVGATRCANLYIKNEVVIKGETYAVTEIADSAFSHHTHIQSVHFPEGIRKIGERSFHLCKGLT